MNRRLAPLLSALLVGGLGGCTMAPKYERPPSPVPQAWKAQEAPKAGTVPSVADLRWQDFFTDPRLRSVIDLALANNRDLRVAALNIEKAQALYRIQRAEMNPTIGIQANGERYRIPESVGEAGQASTVSAYSVNLGLAAWELDFFGRLRLSLIHI